MKPITLLCILFSILSFALVKINKQLEADLAKKGDNLNQIQKILNNEITLLKDDNKRLRYIGVKLYNYADHKRVKRDTALINRMIDHTSNQ